ncbi:MAG: type IV secretory system conjugative DNA transfer family protein [Bacilli bacterium]|nr:type IV secretory system conjugative DNA transfer family protein [Bacilli bacterium]
MNFARWETKENMEKLVPLIPVNKESQIEKSGLPIFYDEKKLYITNRLNHTLVVGTTGSGKTQVVTLPILELSKRSGESVIIHDTKNEIYEYTSEKFKNQGYNIIRINLDDARDCNKWNPLELPYRLYTDGNKDKAQELIEEIGFYLLNELSEKNQDPFWINSAINYFTGLCLYQFESHKSSNLKTIIELDAYIRENRKDFIKNIDKNSNVYLNLRGVLEAPTETCGSILSVFSQKIKRYISRENLMNVLSTTDFDLAAIGKEKTIIYIVSGNSNNSDRLLPLFVSQVYYAKDEYSKNEGKINVIIDDFYELYPIKNFAKVLGYSRGININFVLMIRGFNDLKNIYGKEETEIIKICFANIVYLLSQDMDTLEEISNLCGKTCDDGIVKPLISVEELKTLRPFEAVILMIRMMPFKTKLLPYFQMKL